MRTRNVLACALALSLLAWPAAVPATAQSGGDQPGTGVWKNYDFLPGEEVLFFSDFTDDAIGDFPLALDLAEGNMEVVDWNGRRFLHSTSSGAFRIPLAAPLPERFTVEFEFAISDGQLLGIWFDENGETVWADFGTYFGGLRRLEWEAGAAPDRELSGEVIHGRLMVDGQHAKLYLNEKRVANVPRLEIPRPDRLKFVFGAFEDQPFFITNIRVAAGGRDLYADLESRGRVATQGILFDTGSDRIRPESTPTLAEIAAMLEAHADLRLRIEGHTDAVGDDDANLALSERRAAAVRAYLIDSHAIAADRLESVGLGESQPAASNDTADGRQRNRRVELVKL